MNRFFKIYLLVLSVSIVIVMGFLNKSNALVIVPPGPVVGTTGFLQTGTINQPYSQTLSVSGGVSPYSWTISSGILPPGLNLGFTTGTISGTPTATGTFNFTVQVTDDNLDTAFQDLTLAIAPVSQTGFVFTRTPTGDVVISPLTIRIQGIFGVDFCQDPSNTAYRIQYTSTGGVQRLSQFIPHNQGDVVDDFNQISLLPDTYSNIVKILCDSTGIHQVDDGEIAIPVITIPTSSLADGLIGEQYTQTLQAIGGTVPYTWGVINGFLPSGLILNSSTGEISGIPTTIETANFTVQVQDANNEIATKNLSLTIHGNTLPGQNVVVGPLNGITLTFAEVIQEGHTTVASSSSGPAPPSGFKLGNPPIYYSISTTAIFNPPVEVCVNYDETQFRNENNLKLSHFENGQWVNITTSADTANNIICGEVNDFSEFALFEDLDIDYLADEVRDFNLDEDIEQGLLDKLNAANSAKDKGKDKTARNILKAFTNQVKAQQGKKITDEQAEILLNDADALINILDPGALASLFEFLFFGWLDRILALLL